MHAREYLRRINVDMNMQIGERLQCSIEEKKELLPLIDYIVNAAEKARREGLLALEDDLEECKYPLLRMGLQLVVDGTDPEIIEGILTARVVSGNASGKDFLAQNIIHVAALSIQQGDNPRIIEVKCFAYFGEEAEALQSQFAAEVTEPRDREKVKAFEESDGDFAKRFPEIEKLLGFDDRSIQKVLREIDTKELVSMFYGCSQKVKSKILRNMSKRAATLLAGDAMRGTPSLESVNANVEKVFAIVEKLQQAGEINAP